MKFPSSFEFYFDSKNVTLHESIKVLNTDNTNPSILSLTETTRLTSSSSATAVFYLDLALNSSYDIQVRATPNIVDLTGLSQSAIKHCYNNTVITLACTRGVSK